MTEFKSSKLAAMAAGMLAVLPAQAAGQEPAASANDPLTFVTPQDLENAISLMRPEASLVRSGNSFTITMPSEIKVDARLQNCEDREALRNCRTASVILNMYSPDGLNREELLELANTLNKRDIYGRSFVNDDGHIITRFVFLANGIDTMRSMVNRLAGWEITARRAALSIHTDSR